MISIQNICTERHICFLLVVVFSWSLTTTKAQEALKLQEEKSIGPVSIADEVIGVTATPNSNTLVRLYKKQFAGPAVVSTNEFGGRQMPIVESGLILENGQKVILPENELISGYAGGRIVTIKRDWAADSLVVNKYAVDGGRVAKKARRSFGSAVISAESIENSFLVVADDINVGVTTLGIYDDGLNLVVNYKPFADGFGFYAVDSYADNLLVAAGRTPDLKVSILASKSGQVKAERIFSVPGYSLEEAFFFKNAIITYGTREKEGELAAYDHQLNRLWVRPSRMGRPNLIPCLVNEDGSKLFYVNAFLNDVKQVEFKIVCLNMADGTVRWEYGLKPTPVKTNPDGYRYRGYYITDMDYLPDREAVVATVAHLFTNIERPDQYEYTEGKLIVIDELGRASEHIFFGEGKPFILKNAKQVKVVNRNKVYLYE